MRAEGQKDKKGKTDSVGEDRIEKEEKKNGKIEEKREEEKESGKKEEKREEKQKAEKKKKPLYHLFYFGLVAVLVFLDQMVKEELRGGFPSKTLLPGVLGLTYAENRGMAFGLAQGKGGFLLLFTLFALALLFYLYLIQKGKRGFLYWAREVGILLTMAGAVGNALDRFFFGYVVDYLEFLFVDFPIFNLADCFVVSGVVFLALGLLGEKEGER